MKRITYIGALLLAAATAQAQTASQDTTMNRVVVVENQYNPYLMTSTKLNLYPEVEEPKASTRTFDYARSLRPVSDWGQNEMPLLQRLYFEEQARRGYARLGYGTRGRVEAAAGYTWDATDADRLAVRLALDGWDGTRPAFTTGTFHSRLYRSRAALAYRHRFTAWDFTAGASLRNTVFNYERTATGTYPHQRFTEADIHVGAATTDKDLPLQFTLQTGYRTDRVGHSYPYGLTSNSQVDEYRLGYAVLPAFTEKQIHTVGDLWAPINETQRVGVAFAMDNLFYSGKNAADASVGTDVIQPAEYHSWESLPNYTSLALNPYYAVEQENWRLRLGVHVDPLLGGPDKGVDVAPDVRIEGIFNANSVLYLEAGGGRELNDLRRLTSVTPYVAVPQAVIPTYVPLKAQLGFKISPLPGAWIHVFGGYQIRRSELFPVVDIASPAVYMTPAQLHSKVALAGAEFKYGYKDVFDITLAGTAYGWRLDKVTDASGQKTEPDAGYLAFKPRFEGSVRAEAKVLDPIRIQAGYEYVDRRVGYHAVQNLYTGASYQALRNVQVYARLTNLLNKGYIDKELCPAEKFGFLAGVNVEF